MALQAKLIKAKISSVNNIRKITKAMELVSVSKMKRAVAQTLETRNYATRALEILVGLSKERAIKHTLLKEGPGEKVLLVMISSNKGLCGSFNVNNAKKVNESIEKYGGVDAHDLVTIGKYSERHSKRIAVNVIASFIDIPENPKASDVTGIIKLIIDEFMTGKYSKVMISYTHYISALSNTPVVRQLLPVTKDGIERMITELDEIDHAVTDIGRESVSSYLFEPNEGELLEAVLPRLTGVRIYQAMLESRASEHSSRMFAMKSATENADKLSEDLKLSFNRARQEAITNEISEIASGAEALSY